tara:strand:+ start:392 stop:727 length:336 start_codon:yes stop_codon:yes gene_type:complete
VCISIQSAFNSFDNLTSLREGSINKLVLILFFFKIVIIFSIFLKLFFKFNPPSVVISFLFSGTKQIKLGLFFKAIFNIFKSVAISKFRGIFLLEDIFLRSKSLICLLSSLK